MRILQFQYVFSVGSHFSGLASFWVSFGVSRSIFGSHMAPFGTSFGSLCGFLVSWALLGASWDPSDVQLGLLGSLMTRIWASVGVPGPKIQSRPNIEGPGPCPGLWLKAFGLCPGPWPEQRSVRAAPSESSAKRCFSVQASGHPNRQAFSACQQN